MIPKVMQILEEAPQIYENTYAFMEAADWDYYGDDWKLGKKQLYGRI